MILLQQGRRKQSADGQAQLDVCGEAVNNSRSKRAAKIWIYFLAVRKRSHCTSASNWELPLLCSLSLACTERMRAHLRLYPAGFYYSSSVWERDHTKVEHTIHEDASKLQVWPGIKSAKFH